MAALLAELTAGAAALEGDRAAATNGFADALRRWRDLELVGDRAMCQVTMVATLGEGPDTDAAAQEARRTFERLGSPPLLARLDEALARSGSGMRTA